MSAVQRVSIALALSGALAVAACGGTKTGATGSTTTGGGTTGTTTGAQGGGTFCAAARTYSAAARAALARNIDKTGLRHNYGVWMSALHSLAAITPAQLRADMTIFVTTEDKVDAALKKINYDYTKLDSRTLALLTDRTFLAASDRLTTYLRDTCGIAQTTGNLSSSSP